MKMSQWIILTALVAASVIHSGIHIFFGNICKYYSTLITLNSYFIIVAHSGCSPWDWIKCAAVVTACAAECADTGGAACIACLGPSYDQCKDCIGHQDNINALASLQGEQRMNNTADLIMSSLCNPCMSICMLPCPWDCYLISVNLSKNLILNNVIRCSS